MVQNALVTARPRLHVDVGGPPVEDIEIRFGQKTPYLGRHLADHVIGSNEIYRIGDGILDARENDNAAAVLGPAVAGGNSGVAVR